MAPTPQDRDPFDGLVLDERFVRCARVVETGIPGVVRARRGRLAMALPSVAMVAVAAVALVLVPVVLPGTHAVAGPGGTKAASGDPALPAGQWFDPVAALPAADAAPRDGSGSGGIASVLGPARIPDRQAGPPDRAIPRQRSDPGRRLARR